MRGLIDNRQVATHFGLIWREFGWRCALRCLNAMLHGRPTTFLDLAFDTAADLQAALAPYGIATGRVLVVAPYDKNSMKAIEKAIQHSDLGITPSNDGQVIRLVFPQLTTERRKDLVRVVKHKAEEGRIAIRNLRRAARHELEAFEKDGEISVDELDRAEKELEKLTHEYVAEIDKMLGRKEQELLEV